MAIGSILQGVGSLLGVGSSLLANSQNQSNFDQQMNFAKYQYEDTKRWNSMSEQVKRMRAAGLNPALALSPLGSGQLSSVSQPSPNPQVPLDLSGLSSLATGASLNDAQRKNLDSTTSKNSAETEKINTDVETELMKRDKEIDKILSDKDLNQEMRKYYEQQRDILRKQANYLEENLEWTNHNLRFEAQNKMLDNQAKSIQNQYLPELTDAQIKSLLSTYRMNLALAGEHNANTKYIAQQTITEAIRSGVVGNEFLKGLPDGLKGESYYNALKNNPLFRKTETVLDKVVRPNLQSLPLFMLK